MKTSEFEYYLISELITMQDRILAQQIELLIWAKSPIPQEAILQKFVDICEQSTSSGQFYALAKAYVDSFTQFEWVISFDYENTRVVRDLKSLASSPPMMAIQVSRKATPGNADIDPNHLHR